jgi:hypothetical protein
MYGAYPPNASQPKGTPAQRTSSLASRRNLEKVNGSAVQFGENILKTRGAGTESRIGRYPHS